MLSILIRTYGWRGIVRRGVHELRRNRDWFKSEPAVAGRLHIGRPVLTYRPMGNWQDLSQEQLMNIVARGRKVVDGHYEAYGSAWRQLPHTANQWHVHPSTRFGFPMVTWWKVPLMPAGSDIKDVWEPARFGWVYDLIRAYVATGDRKYTDTFHKYVASWCAANPPFLGPQWACGQEVAIRALAVLHGMDSLPAPPDDPAAIERLESILGWSGERIADAIGYGLSQRNNHGISESAGLVHLGLRLRGAHVDADRWLRHGMRILNEQICDQFSADGWYAQHSFTYMRVALEQALYAERALNAAGFHLSREALSRLDAAVGLLTWLIDAPTGEVPNHGANDGARVLPLSLSTYRDFRSVLTLVSTAVERSTVNKDQRVHVFGSLNGFDWHCIARWTRDLHFTRNWRPYCQHPNVYFAAGNQNSSRIFGFGIAVQGIDGKMFSWKRSELKKFLKHPNNAN